MLSRSSSLLFAASLLAIGVAASSSCTGPTGGTIATPPATGGFTGIPTNTGGSTTGGSRGGGGGGSGGTDTGGNPGNGGSPQGGGSDTASTGGRGGAGGLPSQGGSLAPKDGGVTKDVASTKDAATDPDSSSSLALDGAPVSCSDITSNSRLGVWYYSGSSGVTTQDVQIHLDVLNFTALSARLAQVTVRYWFTDEAPAIPNILALYYVPPTIGKLTTKFIPVNPPRPGADTVLEMSFTPDPDAGASFVETTDFNFSFHKNGYGSTFNLANDYSFNPNLTKSLGANPKITAYINGTLAWGCEPPAPTATPEPNPTPEPSAVPEPSTTGDEDAGTTSLPDPDGAML